MRASANRSALVLLLFCCNVVLAFAQAPTVESVVERSLNAVGTPAERAKLPYMEWTGKAAVRATSNVVAADGTSLLLSEGTKTKLQMKFESQIYGGDQFVFDGDKVMISKDNRGYRTSLGEFLNFESDLLKHGVIGGVLTTHWPLLDLKSASAKVKYAGTKKLDGVLCDVLRYEIKKGGDARMLISMFFDNETGRHVKTVYETSVPAGMGSKGRVSSMDNAELTYVLEETFSDFRKVGTLVFPLEYKLSYTSSNARAGNYVFSMKFDTLNGVAIPAGE